MKKSVLLLIICVILLLHWFTSSTDEMIPKDLSHKANQKENLHIKKNSNFK